MKKVVDKNIKIKLILDDEDVDAIQKTREILGDILTIKENYADEIISEKISIIDDYDTVIEIKELEKCYKTILDFEEMFNPLVSIITEDE